MAMLRPPPAARCLEKPYAVLIWSGDMPYGLAAAKGRTPSVGTRAWQRAVAGGPPGGQTRAAPGSGGSGGGPGGVSAAAPPGEMSAKTARITRNAGMRRTVIVPPGVNRNSRLCPRAAVAAPNASKQTPLRRRVLRTGLYSGGETDAPVEREASVAGGASICQRPEPRSVKQHDSWKSEPLFVAMSGDKSGSGSSFVNEAISHVDNRHVLGDARDSVL